MIIRIERHYYVHLPAAEDPEAKALLKDIAEGLTLLIEAVSAMMRKGPTNG